MTVDVRPVVFNPATNSIVDYVHAGETPEVAVQRLAEYGTALTVLPLDEAWKRHEDAYRSEPVEISHATFTEMLGVLPPVAWCHTPEEESFKISELTTGQITAIYVRLRERYFSFSDSITLSHVTCCKIVTESPAFLSPAPVHKPADEPQR